MNTVKWHVENKVILFDVVEELTIDDLKQANQEITAMLEAGTAPIHLIYRASDTKTPTDISQVRDSLTFLSHPNFGWIITIGVNRLVSFIGKVVANLAKIDLKAVATMDEAEATLQRIDSAVIIN